MNITYENNGTDSIYYTYDSSDKLLSMNLNGTDTQVVSYTYGSWGKPVNINWCLKDTVSVKNLYRYRGYYYDTETGFYSLLSRYYDPEIGRFINADDTSYLF